ncbi:hypothetical protein A3K34_04005 [candidate division WWE3 bacterium RIFOXYC1_FULL_40_10]|uniref:Uncharacterized protein n=1 Tax=candidate division WWE3 bacterium RIFOXYA2_FULL_46_9 TaxID=1802636 RepID=A0A1F4W0H4_UNCKA|nr:MAG: hypothetical protein A3K58_04005 [candidate division WWE3 bacterium RIFOXYB1_FULL_40_22]OGC62005.1 MAG: hypothetical protein A3K37_04005 [candidate division WWE3 bacterium RIFOXYA1_FULL_40_11]OGC62922.1 MAG: hypothetical protein A2264_03520 [candidate division WWE3 bacterium RIFOXYA2_FULL_46_9]OGC66388.1 MAG: hypothetical protein A3K34_04005 [candidate division WWE3 bacterium RIFOXYC1_FULL_40_10]OGC67989.1 MAG: hypothetical protein A2450_02200 [candidate division WWE3 bacterium RIFOXYC2
MWVFYQSWPNIPKRRAKMGTSENVTVPLLLISLWFILLGGLLAKAVIDKAGFLALVLGTIAVLLVFPCLLNLKIKAISFVNKVYGFFFGRFQ